jgi:hypothetical protein
MTSSVFQIIVAMGPLVTEALRRDETVSSRYSSLVMAIENALSEFGEAISRSQSCLDEIGIVILKGILAAIRVIMADPSLSSSAMIMASALDDAVDGGITAAYERKKGDNPDIRNTTSMCRDDSLTWKA